MHECASYALRSFPSQSDEVQVAFLVEMSESRLVRPLFRALRGPDLQLGIRNKNNNRYKLPLANE
jgi:hypothetical protein